MNAEFRRYLEALDGEWEDRLGRHLEEDELIAYVRGQLETADVERMQSHLLCCAACAATLKDVADFFEPRREGEESLSQRAIHREWETFWRRVQAEEGVVTPKGIPRWFVPRAVFALAASLLVAVGLVGFWSWHLRQESQELARQLQAERDRRADLEQENRRLQEQARALARTYESQIARLESHLAELREPQPNIPVYDLFSREFFVRSGSADVANRIVIPATTRSFSLVLTAENQPEYPSYTIELVDREERLRWRAVGLRRDRHGNFTLTLNRAFLSPGEYRLLLYGQQDGRLRRIAEYVLSLRSR